MCFLDSGCRAADMLGLADLIRGSLLINHIAILEDSYLLSRTATMLEYHPTPDTLSTMMSLTTQDPPVLEIWIDGDCEVCRRSEEWCSARDERRRLRFVDLHAPDSDEPPGSPEAMMRAVHVRHADGTVRTGFDAWRRILAELDGWRWLASGGRSARIQTPRRVRLFDGGSEPPSNPASARPDDQGRHSSTGIAARRASHRRGWAAT